jgi:hypothetical protein
MSMKYGRMAYFLMGSIFAQPLFGQGQGQGQGNDLPNRVGELEERVGDLAELIEFGIEADIAELASNLKDLETAILAHRRADRFV